jgi:hypothetical protein
MQPSRRLLYKCVDPWLENTGCFSLLYHLYTVKKRAKRNSDIDERYAETTTCRGPVLRVAQAGIGRFSTFNELI